MSRPRDLTGCRFGRLLVIAYSHSIPRRPRGAHRYWTCQCDCGRVATVLHDSLIGNNTRSCGCLRSQTTAARHYAHGQAIGRGTALYRAWRSMKVRCYRKTALGYATHGARGITVCDRWLHSFTAFAEDMGPHPGYGYSLDRKDNNGNYSPENCRWATRTEQNRNTRRNHRLFFRGEWKCLSEWAHLLHLRPGTILLRLRLGWTVERALATPVRTAAA